MPNSPQYDDKQLFLQISRGDEQAFTELFHFYAPKLLPFITKLTRHQELAQEMIQETFLRLWIKRVELTGVEHPAAYIYKIASNVSINFLKTQSNRRKLLLQNVQSEEKTDSLPENLDARELDLIIQRAVNMLPERRQQIYRLSREEGLSHQRIAELLNISINTVKNQMGIALKFVQEYINTETGLSIVTLMILFRR